MRKHEFAIGVANEFVKNEKKDLAIELIIAILSVVVQQCVLNYFRVKNPSFFDKIRLKWVVQSYTKEKGVAEAIIAKAKNLTLEEYLELHSDLSKNES